MAFRDVLIVGGGPAGSTCAWKLRQAGLDVVVWDRQAFPRDKVCAGWITPQVVAALELDLGTYAAGGLTAQPIRGFRVSCVGDRDVRVQYDAPVSYGIRRCEFDHYLLQRSGATLHLGDPVRTLRRVNDGWMVNESISAKLLIGAGGHFCPVAQQLGARLGHGEPIVAAQEVEVAITPEDERDCRVDADTPEIFFTRDLKGYGWVFRKGRYINIGLGRLDTHKLTSHVAEFVALLRERGKTPAHLPALRGHPYLLYDHARRPLVGDRALLVGDAAGLAYPRSGEGIRTAVESGLLAAETILEAHGEYEPDSLAPYERRITERFGPREAWSLTDALPAWLTHAMARPLFHRAWFARSIVLDQWFFHAHQSPLTSTPPSTRLTRQVAAHPHDPLGHERAAGPPQSRAQ